MTASEARALVKESVVYKELSLYNDIDNKIRKEAADGRSTCIFNIQNPNKNQLTNICCHYRNLGFTATFHIHNGFKDFNDIVTYGTIYLSWSE